MNKKATENYDVVVAGGGSAGVAAAIGAARMGARTLLLERYQVCVDMRLHAAALGYPALA